MSLPPVSPVSFKSRMVYISGASLPDSPGKQTVKRVLLFLMFKRQRLILHFPSTTAVRLWLTQYAYYFGTEKSACTVVFIKNWAPKHFALTSANMPRMHGTKLSVQSPRSIWAVVAKFHTNPSYHSTGFQFFLQIVVTDFSYRHDLLRYDARHLRHAWRHFLY